MTVFFLSDRRPRAPQQRAPEEGVGGRRPGGQQQREGHGLNGGLGGQ